MTVLDTSFLFALLMRSEKHHEEAAAWYERSVEGYATTPLVLTELDHLFRARSAPSGRKAFFTELRAGTLGVEWRPDLPARSVEVVDDYADLGVSLTDASLVVLAAEFETTRIATFDERHFRAMKPLAGGDSFTLLPADA